MRALIALLVLAVAVPVFAAADRDADGIIDAVDQCPDTPEDRDGFQDADGCPDPDNDQDGIVDTNDQCPNEPEDKDGFQDADGCPDPDNDKDGIADASDRCPNEPETFNNYQDDDGCPDSISGGKAPSEAAKEATLEITSSVWADVRLDGKLVGKTPLTLRVYAGKHRVTLSNGPRSQTRELEIKPGTPTRLHVTL